MIGKLTGRVDYQTSDHVLIDTGGVGYLVYCSERTLANLPPAGNVAVLYTEMLVREDLLQLFGFLTPYEREWHRLLVSVQGIGAKAAMAIMGTLGADGVSQALAIGDWAAIKAAPGIGPKIAQRVVNELKDKAPAIIALGATLDQTAAAAPDANVVIDADLGAPTPAPQSPPPAPSMPSAGATRADAMSALSNLGYSPSEAASAVAQAARDAPDADTQTLIRAALKALAPQS
jgi:Holliday junction DNA helicase RuvA